MKKQRNYYQEIDNALLAYENSKPWCWKFRHITKEQMEELADRVCIVLEQ